MRVVLAAGAVFSIVLVYLALQVRAGADPAIGAGEQVQTPPPARRVVVIETRVVERGRDSAAPGSSAPPSAAPAPAPAAPAPAPAPPVSRAS